MLVEHSIEIKMPNNYKLWKFHLDSKKQPTSFLII